VVTPLCDSVYYNYTIESHRVSESESESENEIILLSNYSISL